VSQLHRTILGWVGYVGKFGVNSI